jgi:SAM-dependent methyltransferase
MPRLDPVIDQTQRAAPVPQAAVPAAEQPDDRRPRCPARGPRCAHDLHAARTAHAYRGARLRRGAQDGSEDLVVAHHYTEPSRLTRLGYRLLYDPLRARQLHALVTSLRLSGRERILDVGSGSGAEAALLATALAPGGHLTCLDVSSVWLAEARRRLRRFANVELVLGEAPDVGLADRSFDVVLANFVLHDIDRLALAGSLDALARALKPDGRFVVVEPTASRHGFGPGELEAAMTAAGFRRADAVAIRTAMGAAERSEYRLGAAPASVPAPAG